MSASEKFRVVCVSCGKVSGAYPRHVGRTAKCKGCGKTMKIEAPESVYDAKYVPSEADTNIESAAWFDEWVANENEAVYNPGLNFGEIREVTDAVNDHVAKNTVDEMQVARENKDYMVKEFNNQSSLFNDIFLFKKFISLRIIEALWSFYAIIYLFFWLFVFPITVVHSVYNDKIELLAGVLSIISSCFGSLVILILFRMFVEFVAVAFKIHDELVKMNEKS